MASKSNIIVLAQNRNGNVAVTHSDLKKYMVRIKNERKMKRVLCRSTGAQIRFMIDYMTRHPQMAKNEYPGGLNGQEKHDYEWSQLKNLLKEYGPDKGVDQWKHTWRDLKKKARISATRNKEADRNGVAILGPALPSQTMRILRAIGECENDGEIEESSLDNTVDMPWSKEQNDEDESSEKKARGSIEVFTSEANEDPLESEQDQEREQEQEHITADDSGHGPILFSRLNGETKTSSKGLTFRPIRPRPQPINSSASGNVRQNNNSVYNSTQIDAINTLNTFIQYEREKEQLSHEREMSRLSQNDRVLHMAEKFVNILEVLTPSITRFLDRN